MKAPRYWPATSWHKDVPTCRVHDPVDGVSDQMLGRAWDLCVILDDGGIVQGVIDSRTLQVAAGPHELHAANAEPPRLVGDSMTFGISTVRPSEDVPALLERMRQAGISAILVTSSDAHLLGVLIRAQAEAVIHELHTER